MASGTGERPTPDMIPAESRTVYRYNAYRAESTNTITVQLNKDFINNGTTYSLFGPLYFIDYNSTPTVDEYYMLMNPTNPNRIIRVTTNNTARNIASAAYDMSTGILTVTLSGNRAYSGADVYISHV